MSEARGSGHRPNKPEWYQRLAQYERPNMRCAIRQLSNTVLPMLVILSLMIYLATQDIAYGVILAMSGIPAILLMRTFIILHDCSHNSFFPSPRANAILGFFLGVLTLTPFGQWRWSHLTHHATFANLDRRGLGDVQLMTVDEYRAASRLQRLVYRIYRHPLFMFGFGSTMMFACIYRFPIRGARRDARNAVWVTDGAILAIAAGAWLTVGLRPVLLVMAPVWFITWMAAVWVFYIQHQFTGVYWARRDAWDFFRASLEGASYYQLPVVLQWITGNIGFHHLHHLRPRIPNYTLQQAFAETPEVQAVTPLTLSGSLKCPDNNLYDERRQQMVSFRALRR